jgi:hypothetical protein
MAALTKQLHAVEAKVPSSAKNLHFEKTSQIVRFGRFAAKNTKHFKFSLSHQKIPKDDKIH